jgi:hypothetical protein
MGDVIHVPFGQILGTNDPQFSAAMRWLMAELTEPVSTKALRALAERELRRPRDGIHKSWAKTFLASTEKYK